MLCYIAYALRKLIDKEMIIELLSYSQQVETEFNQKSLMKKTGPTKISSPGLSLGQGQTKMTKKSGCCPEARDGRSQIALQMA